MKPSQIKGTIWSIMLYHDDENYSKYLQNIQNNYNYAMITHDKDRDEEGKLKKEHTHVVIFTAQTTLSSITYMTQVPMNYIEVKASKRFAIRYLTHIDFPNKFRYEIDEIQGNIENWKKFFKDANEDDAIYEILETIQECKKAENASITMLISKIVAKGLYGYWRQGQATFMQIWKE